MKSVRRQQVMVLCLLLSIAAKGFGRCPDHYYSGLFGKCFPEIGGSVGQATEHMKDEAKAQVLGPILETWINQSRATSINGAQPIPTEIRAALSGYTDEDSLNRAKYKIGDAGVLNLGGLSLKYGDVLGGDVQAITLNDVIVFRNADDAQTNASLWAHELTHVRQFQDKGVHGFAIAYARRSWDIEGPAYAKGDNWGAWATVARPVTRYYWIGLAWNDAGNFWARTNLSPDTAQVRALHFCNRMYGNCYNTRFVVPGDRLMCYAITQNGTTLYANQEPTQSAAVAAGQNACGDVSCKSVVSACNDRNFVGGIRDMRFYANYQNDHAQFDGHSDASLDAALQDAKQSCEQSGLPPENCKLLATEDIDDPSGGYHLYH